MLSVEQFLPTSDDPKHLRKVVERQGLWIGNQNETNRVHWGEIVGLKTSLAEERRDRMARDELVLAMVAQVQKTVDRIENGSRLAVIVGRVAFAVAGLLVAAKAAGMF